ncbi:hypothetical protein MNBD_GAMMA18-1007 [hydrothermal vent metagenome]|uniref:Uncharacterized protein n=1 Tax=hydrothermal vent metagenome TaxID=652676 RepID=A0A3B1A258_9ZZZZ
MGGQKHNISLVDAYLNKSSFEFLLAREIVIGNSGGMGMESTINISPEASDKGDCDTIIVTINTNSIGYMTIEGNREKAFKILSEAIGIFSCSDFSIEDFNSVPKKELERILLNHLYPIVRQEINHALNSMGIPGIRLPWLIDSINV